MKRREQVIAVVTLYKQHKLKEANEILRRYGITLHGDISVEVTSERLFEFLQSTELPPHLAHFRLKSKRELAQLLKTHLNKKERRERRPVFIF